MKPTVSIYFDPRYTIENRDDYPFKLRVWSGKSAKLYPLDMYATKKDAAKILVAKPKGGYKTIKDDLDSKVASANAAIEKLRVFSFELFEREYFKTTDNDTQGVYGLWEEYIISLREEERAGSAKAYNNAFVSVKKYQPDLIWTGITPDFLKGYERKMLKDGRASTTVGMYTTCLRTIVNLAIEKGFLLREEYPFGERKYSIPGGQNIKKALRIVDVARIYQYNPEPDTWEEKARDFWLFSYLANGMNIEDIANLRFSNVIGDKIEFVRQKTRRKERTQKKIEVFLNDNLREIITRWGNSPGRPDDYLFNIFHRRMDAEERLLTRCQFIKQVNKYMRTIGKAVGIEKDITTYTARHTFANVMKQSGAPIALISDSLGHSDATVTENYLGSFEDNSRRAWANKLTEF